MGVRMKDPQNHYQLTQVNDTHIRVGLNVAYKSKTQSRVRNPEKNIRHVKMKLSCESAVTKIVLTTHCDSR